MYIKKYKIFLEELNQTDKKDQQNNSDSQKPTDEVDNILKDTEKQKQRIIAKKDTIEKGLLNNIRELEPENQEDVQTQVKDYRDQVKEFDNTVKQIGKLNKTLQKSNRPSKFKPRVQIARDKYNV